MAYFSDSSYLKVEGLTLELCIGCTEEEQKQPQPIEIELVLFFARPPLGAVSDELKDIVCYHECIQTVRKTAMKKRFHLIEHLAYEIHTTLAKELPMNLTLMVTVRKKAPPVAGLQSVSFTYFPQKAHEEKKTNRPWDWE